MGVFVGVFLILCGALGWFWYWSEGFKIVFLWNVISVGGFFFIFFMREEGMISQSECLGLLVFGVLFFITEIIVGKYLQKREKEEAKLYNAEIAKKNRDKHDKEILERHAELSRYDKRIAMLEDMVYRYKSKAEALTQRSNTIYNASQEKEKDWAILGGIADGIAGPAAGIATAINTQVENMEIRRQNAERAKQIAPMISHTNKEANSALRSAEALEREIKTVKTKLISDMTAEECFDKLLIKEPKCNILESGSYHIEVAVSLKNPFFISKDVEGVIDGTISAKMYDRDEYMGEAKLVLPEYGLKSSTKLEGIIICDAKDYKQYTIKFSPYKLWAMEL